MYAALESIYQHIAVGIFASLLRLRNNISQNALFSFYFVMRFYIIRSAQSVLADFGAINHCRQDTEHTEVRIDRRPDLLIEVVECL